VVHKERNLFGYLRKAYHAESKRLWRRLRLAEGAQAGREALADLRAFVATRNAAALASLDQAVRIIPFIQLSRSIEMNAALMQSN
jgi:hypothetical protein